jgi:hypothetical protein
VRGLVAAVVSLTALVPRATAADDCRIEMGAHFRVICHFESDACASAALETAEAIWPIASALYGLPAAPLETPLDVHLYRRAADYLVQERELAIGTFDRNLAFWSFETRSAYVAVQPDLTDETLAAIGLTAQTRHLVAHEAAHLVRGRASSTFRSHPAWFADGVALWIEEEAMTARGWSAGQDEDPLAAHDAVLAKRLLDGGALPSVARILRDDLRDLDIYDRYAVRKLLFRRLATRRDAAAFRAALATALKLEDGPDFAARFLAAATAPYATEGPDGLDLDIEQYVRSLTPAWDERARALSTDGSRWVQTAFSTDAVAWRTAPVGGDAYEVRGELEILPGAGEGRQMSVLLGRAGDRSFVSVVFGAADGVTIGLAHERAPQWKKLASAPTKLVQLGRRLPFRVTVGAGKVAVQLDGVDVGSAEVGDRPMSGPWGLGVAAGGAGIWRGVKVESFKTR